MESSSVFSCILIEYTTFKNFFPPTMWTCFSLWIFTHYLYTLISYYATITEQGFGDNLSTDKDCRDQPLCIIRWNTFKQKCVCSDKRHNSVTVSFQEYKIELHLLLSKVNYIIHLLIGIVNITLTWLRWCFPHHCYYTNPCCENLFKSDWLIILAAHQFTVLPTSAIEYWRLMWNTFRHNYSCRLNTILKLSGPDEILCNPHISASTIFLSFYYHMASTNLLPFSQHPL